MYGNTRTVIPVTIASGQSLSAEVNVGAKRIVGIQMPAGWDTAGITFVAVTRQTNAAVPTVTYGKVQDAGGTELLITTPVADAYVAIAPTAATDGLGRIKVRSGVAATPVNQTADRNFFLVCTDC
jgi:hypothetical protein